MTLYRYAGNPQRDRESGPVFHSPSELEDIPSSEGKKPEAACSKNKAQRPDMELRKKDGSASHQGNGSVGLVDLGFSANAQDAEDGQSTADSPPSCPLAEIVFRRCCGGRRWNLC
jgi:hypothetical protein